MKMDDTNTISAKVIFVSEEYSEELKRKEEKDRIVAIQKKRDHQEYMKATHPTFATIWPRVKK